MIALALAGVAVPASAGSISVSTTTLGGVGLASTGLDHHKAYTWTLNGINMAGGVAQSATLTFFNFYNWTSAAADPNNIIFMNLLDGTQSSQSATACTGTAGITCTSDSMTDNNAAGTMNVHDISNAFQVAQDAGGSGVNNSVIGLAGMVSSSTPITYLGSSRNTADAGQSAFGYNAALVGNNPNGVNGTGAFTDSVHVTWTYTFNSAQLAALTAYINNGSAVAFGLDPDCHFFMDSIQFSMTYGPAGTSAVPEPGSLALLATGMAYLWKRRTKKAQTI